MELSPCRREGSPWARTPGGEAELSLAAPLSHPLNVMVDVPALGRVLFFLQGPPADDEEALELVLPLAGGEIELLAPAQESRTLQVAFVVRSDGAYTMLPLHPEDLLVRMEEEGRWVLGPRGPGSYQLLRLPSGAGEFGCSRLRGAHGGRQGGDPRAGAGGHGGARPPHGGEPL